MAGREVDREQKLQKTGWCFLPDIPGQRTSEGKANRTEGCGAGQPFPKGNAQRILRKER